MTGPDRKIPGGFGLSRTFVLSAWMILFLEGSAASAAEPVNFSRDIRPLLSDRCFACHGPDRKRRKKKLRLDLGLEEARKVISPGKPLKSELLGRITAEDPDDLMPPLDSGKKQLSAAEKDLFRRWISEGARFDLHWAYVKPGRPEPPKVSRKGWARNPVDHFIATTHEKMGLAPSPEADRRTLLRRLHFDLTGLPPTPAELDAFLADKGPRAYDQQVERLLASPHFGERLAIYWLDLVRYADSAGYHSDPTINISPYRDYVIEAFNSNKPFDRFTLEQLAGDLLPDASMETRVASGYNRLNKTTDEGGAQPKEYLAKYAADRVRTTSAVWMGVTMGCAECHDHKFDPFTTKDFYSFAAFFADLKEVGHYGGSSRPPELQVPVGRLKARWAALKKEIEELEKAPNGDKNRLQQLQKEKGGLQKSFTKTLVSQAVKPRVMRVLPRGNWLDDSGEVVVPAIPKFLGSLGVKEGRATRLDLARWFVQKDNPLTARVFVNRLWKLYFGSGISSHLDDVGVQGEWPRHPELLDWLALEFMESGWDIKHMIRLLVTSSSYRQSSLMTDRLQELDPYNRLIARQSRYRVAAELVRDAALFISGLLVDEVGGRSVKPYQPAGYWKHLNFPKRKWQHDKGSSQYRRGIYTHWQRTFLHPSLLAFDAPSREECTAERMVSNTPQAALALLNDPTYVEAARAFAQNISFLGGESVDERLDWAFRQALSRKPSADERAILRKLLEAHRKQYRADSKAADALLAVGLTNRPEGSGGEKAELAAWTSISRVILNLSETITRN